MTETGKVFLRYLYKRFGWKVIHHRKKLFRIIHKRAFETSMKKLKFVIFTNAPCKGLNSNTAMADDDELVLFTWENMFPQEVLDGFTEETGI